MLNPKNTNKKISKIFLAIISVLTLNQATFAQESEQQSGVTIYPYEKTFTITAYYSPIEGQSRYIKGSLEADRRLNGNGTHGASGTPVYPGMIAAPKSYAFGTKMKVPGVGIVSVQDRGGAIVASNNNNSFDRLDIWMGHGDEGLNRAMQWGKRNVTVLVYGIDENIQEEVNFESVQAPNNPTPAPTSAPSPALSSPYTKSFSLGDQSNDISQLQEDLKSLNYYQGETHGAFDQETQNAVIKFQIDQKIVSAANQYGAGYFGPQTGKALLVALNNSQNSNSSSNNSSSTIPQALANSADSKTERIALAGNGLSFLERDLRRGDSGQAVLELQTELKKLNLLALEPTGFYGEVTEHAIFKFQQNQNLVLNKTDSGAGAFAGETRKAIAELVEARIDLRRNIKNNQDPQEEQQI